MSFNFDISDSIYSINNSVDSNNNLVERPLSLDESVNDDPLTPDSIENLDKRSVSLDGSIYNAPFTPNSDNHFDISLDESISSVNIELEHIIDNGTKELNKCKSLDNVNTLSIPRSINDNRLVLSDSALFCLKALFSPIAIFSHVARFILSAIGTAFSFAIAFIISDIMFFSILDKFSLSYARYVLLGVTGVIALSSIKEIVVSFVNLSLSFFKGMYSWYFSLVNPDCSLGDFLLGRNTMTKN